VIRVTDTPPRPPYIASCSQQEVTMTPHTTNRRTATRSILLAFAASALLVGAGAPVESSDGHTVSHLTFNRAVSLPGAVLQPGAYTFEALRPDLVRVSSRDGLRVLYTGFTYRVPRPAGLARDAFVSFGEAPRGEPMPIREWYPVARGLGHQFIWR
jgi:hypothetical protein